jgi:hypothetical protein
MHVKCSVNVVFDGCLDLLFDSGFPLVADTVISCCRATFFSIDFEMFGLRSKKQHNFERIRRTEDHENLLVDGERSPLDEQPTRSNARGPSWLATVVVVVCTAVLSAAFGAFVTQHERLDADSFSIRHSSQYCQLSEEL